ncbi:MAG: hypothetical protein II054_09835, partial [Treponema sp.]|nr:hypothetical protein [Treponema sp.]
TPLAVLKAENIEMPKLSEIFESAEESALEYYKMEAKFAADELEMEKTASENGSHADAQSADVSAKTKTRTRAKETQKEVRTSKKSVTATPAQRFKSFCKEIEYLASVMANSQGIDISKDLTASSRYKITSSAFKASADNIIYEGLLEYKCASDVLCSFAMVSSAGRENCLKWGYDRKLSEFLNKTEVQDPNLRETFRKLFITMRIRDMNFGASSFAKSSYETAKLLLDGPNSRLLAGTNEFNGIKWFNKERIESTMWFALAGVTMYSPRILREQIHRLYRTLSAARDASEYQCEKFLAALKPEKKSSSRTKGNVILGESATKKAVKTSAKKSGGD